MGYDSHVNKSEQVELARDQIYSMKFDARVGDLLTSHKKQCSTKHSNLTVKHLLSHTLSTTKLCTDGEVQTCTILQKSPPSGSVH